MHRWASAEALWVFESLPPALSRARSARPLDGASPLPVFEAVEAAALRALPSKEFVIDAEVTIEGFPAPHALPAPEPLRQIVENPVRLPASPNA